MVSEAALESTEHGLVPTGKGWFVVNAREAVWTDRKGRGFYCGFEGEAEFPQIGINLRVLGPGEPMAMYHREHDQEGLPSARRGGAADRRGRRASAAAMGLRPLPSQHEPCDPRCRELALPAAGGGRG